MSILVEESKKLIIDRTLIHMNIDIQALDSYKVVKFLKLLYGLGVDLIEINSDIASKVKELPEDLNYTLRMNKDSDIFCLNKYKFDYIVIEYNQILNFSCKGVSKLKNNKVMLEIDIENLDELYLDENNKIFSMFNIKCIRIKNISKYNLKSFTSMIMDLKTNFLVKVDICADNKFYMGTAITMEACVDGADFITTIFNGENYGYTPLEEIIVALKVIKKGILHGDLKLLPAASGAYTELTGESIYNMKPVLGEDIFKYESGIHVDGIAKDSKTYEPYEPKEIGKERKMLIGKHSGRKAVMVKLKELNVDYTFINMEAFLSEIRVNSIKLKRNILDYELIEMSKGFNNFY